MTSPVTPVDTGSVDGIIAASGNTDLLDPRNLGGAEGYGITGTPNVSTPPVAIPPVAIPPVAEQTQQAFAPYDAERMLKINEIPTANPDLLDPLEPFGGAGEYGTSGTVPIEPAAIAKSPSTVAPTAQTFKQAFAANRLAGNETFIHKGKSYTTQTAEEAAPKGTNSLYQQTANLFTPNDDKEYVGGVLQDRAGKATNTLYQRVANALTPDDGKEYVGGSIKETKTRTPASSSRRSTSSIQKDINARIKSATTGGKTDWKKANVGSLVKERESARSGGGSTTGQPYSAAANTARVAAQKAAAGNVGSPTSGTENNAQNALNAVGRQIDSLTTGAQVRAQRRAGLPLTPAMQTAVDLASASGLSWKFN